MLAILVFFNSFFQVQQPSLPVTTPVDTLAARTLEINRIIILGNKITRDRIILRELSFKPGDTISSLRLDDQLVKDRAKIYNLRLFNTVVVRHMAFDSTRVDLIIEVSERWYTFPSPLLEIADRNFNDWYQNYNHDWGRINYGMRLYQTNFRGRNEKVRFTTQFGFVRKFVLTYSIPNIGKSQKHGLVFDIAYDEPKNLNYFTEDHVPQTLGSETTLKRQLGTSVSYSYRKSFYETHSFSVDYLKSRVADTIPMLNPNFYPEGSNRLRYTSIGYSFNSEHRDVIAYPMKGYQFTFYLQKTGLGLGQDVNQLEANITYAHHVDIGKGLNFSNFSAVYASTPTSQPYTMYGALGYRRQLLRGYETKLIEGPQYFLNKSTLKKKIFAHAWTIDDMPLEQFSYFPIAIYLKCYFDFGYVTNYPRYEELQVNTRLSSTMLASAGFGLDLVTLYDNVFRFEYTFTRQGTQGFYFHVKKEF
jgi:outer membrane protein assembly factor BamA